MAADLLEIAAFTERPYRKAGRFSSGDKRTFLTRPG
jgi:hypothetical protein